MKTLIICINRRSNPAHPSCAARGSVELADATEAAISSRQLPIQVERSYCLGYCERGPNLKIAPAGRFIHEVTSTDIEELLTTLSAEQNQ